jgi:hypothetical protein
MAGAGGAPRFKEALNEVLRGDLPNFPTSGFSRGIGGGAPSPYLVASAELYDTTMGTFAVTGSMATVRSGHTATCARTRPTSQPRRSRARGCRATRTEDFALAPRESVPVPPEAERTRASSRGPADAAPSAARLPHGTASRADVAYVEDHPREASCLWAPVCAGSVALPWSRREHARH